MRTDLRPSEADHGFTLIELLVVVVVIGILAAVAIPTFLSHRQRAWDSAAWADLRNAATAMQAHYVVNGTFVGGPGESPGASDGVTVRLAPNPPVSESFYCLEADHVRLSGTGTWDWHISSATSFRAEAGPCS